MSNETTNPAIDAAESANANGKDQNVYGFCPQCGSPGVNRERRIDGNDRCYHGHIYPSSKAVYRAVVSPAHRRADQGSQTMSNTHTEVVAESRPPIPKDPGIWIVRYWDAGEWRTALYHHEKHARRSFKALHKAHFPAARLIRILPEGEGRP